MPDLEHLIPNGMDLLVYRFALPSGRIGTSSIGGDPNTTFTLQDRANAARTAWDTGWKSVTDTNYTLNDVTVYHSNGGLIVSAVSSGSPIAGTAAKTSAPCELALGLRKRTGFVGKGYRGRMYWPVGLSETNVDEGGVISSTSLTDYTTHLQTWLNALVGAGKAYENLMVFHNTQPENPETGARTAIPIVSMDVSPVCVSQRRRRTRV